MQRGKNINICFTFKLWHQGEYMGTIQGEYPGEMSDVMSTGAVELPISLS